MKNSIKPAILKVFFVVFTLAVALFQNQNIFAQTFQTGDVFVSVSDGSVQWRSPTGALIKTLNTHIGYYTTGMAFDADSNLYVTNFDINIISKFDKNGVLMGTFGSEYKTPESIIFDSSGNAYVGNVARGILKFDASGKFLSSSYPGRVDWLDLRADQCTMLYTFQGTQIFQHDVCTNTPLPPFASGLGASAYALRIRSNGEVLLANSSSVLRLSSAGNVLQSYDAPGEDSWFAMSLNPDGSTFWSADFTTANVYKIDIATGNILSTFNTGTGDQTVFGLAVFGEFTVSTCAKNVIPPTFISPTPACGSVIQATVGNPLNFTISVSDADVANVVSLDTTNLPAGATVTSALPATGNPVSSMFSWTPSVSDVGQHSVSYAANDGCNVASCSFTISVQQQQACTVNAVCKNISVTLVNGRATITGADVDGGSTATCGIKSLFVYPYSYDISTIGPNNAVLTLTDNNGNTATCNAIVTVVASGTGCNQNPVNCVIEVKANPVVPGQDVHTIYKGYGPQKVLLHGVPRGGVGPYQYSWNGGLTFLPDGFRYADPKKTTTYNLIIKDIRGCTSTCSVTIKVEHVPTTISRTATSDEISEESSTTSIKAYPNPAKDNVTIEWTTIKEDHSLLKVLDMQGRILIRRQFYGLLNRGKNIKTIELNGFAKGLYLLQISGADGDRTIKFAVK